MSEKKAKTERKLNLVTEDVDWKKTAKEQAQQIGKMYVDRDKKALAAKEHLVSSLDVTSDKYRTANGVMAALDAFRDVIGDKISIETKFASAMEIAHQMSDKAAKMCEKAKILDPEQMDLLCEGFYDPDFCEHEYSAFDMALELMVLRLCQNVGPDAQDIVDFCKTADDEIAKARDALRTFCTEHDVNFYELCGEGGDYLCLSCVKTCGDESKVIHEGQSAYDVCEDFVDKCEGE